MTFTAKGDETTAGADTSHATGEEQSANQPSYITAKELNDMEQRLSQSIGQRLDQLYQGFQSRQDKFTAKVNKQMEAYENAAKANNVQLTDTQRQMLQNSAFMQALDAEASTQQQAGMPGQAGKQTEEVDQLVRSVNDAADAILKEMEIEVDENDPDYISIVKPTESGTPTKYLSAILKYAEAKKAQTSQTVQPQPNPATDISPGLVRGKPQSNPIAEITDPKELWELAKF